MTTNDNASLPTRPMEPIRLDNLLINFTSEFNRIWTSNGSRAKPATFWRPAPAPDLLPGYFPLGDILIPNNTSINGESVAAVVCEGALQEDGNTRGKALSRPTDFELVWKESGAGSATRTSIWRPIAPQGYVALGMTCSSDHGKPSLNAIRCVRADLVVSADLGDLVWDDKGSGATLNFSAWSINPPTAEAGEICFAPGTFIGAPSHNKPATGPFAYALQIQIPVQVSAPAEPPVLTTHLNPESGAAKVTQIARLPWFAVRDYAQPNDGFHHSRHYDLKRTDQYVLVGYGRNTTEQAQSIKWTAPRAQNAAAMRLFNRHTAVEFTKAWPAAMLSDIRATKFSACLPRSFTHTETSSNEWSESDSRVVIAMAAKHKSVAVYQMESHYELVREDGTEVTVPLGYTDDTRFVMSEYPPEAVETATLMPVTAGIPSTETITSGASVVAQSSPESSTVTDSAP
ncbi:Vps62-related protein [Pseudomonas sp. TNT2022 ID233]|uniref:Vps62-related protein n=1 Tax=Pseudomonas aphyarum TaxID=2942629 RepID=UPI00235FFA76|nr:Vps62-related protein [Pseudomonas aphyarum]MDD1137093.1 Vps62-related protein [Pseudomonas aphyarum]